MRHLLILFSMLLTCILSSVSLVSHDHTQLYQAHWREGEREKEREGGGKRERERDVYREMEIDMVDDGQLLHLL